MTRKDALKKIETDLEAAIDAAAAAGRGKVFVGNSLALWFRGNSASWIYHYRNGATMTSASLGTYPDVSLYAARQTRNRLAATRRASRPRGAGVTAERQLTAQTHITVAEPAKRARFADLVEEFLANAPAPRGWKPTSAEPHKYSLLKTGALGKMWTDQITKTDVAAELKARWPNALNEADHNRMRLKAVFDYARAAGYRADDQINPANNSDLKNLIEKPAQSVPFAAMPLGDLPAFMGALAADGSNTARALAFCVHTAARTDEARLADWSEITGNVWNVPASRMKEGKAHSVPLSPAALALLGKPGKGLIFGKLAERALINRVKAGGPYTTHGFRSAFTGFAKKAGYSKELRDLALAHVTGSATDNAYDRERLIEERRPLNVAWSEFLTSYAK